MPNLVELRTAFPQCQLWWDSLPWDIDEWQEGISRHGTLELPKPFVAVCPVRVFTGVTTNPRLVFTSLDKGHRGWIASAVRQLRPERGTTYWSVYRQLFVENAQLLRPIWDATEGDEGWISAQLPPDTMLSIERMVSLGAELAALAPNVMVKVPANREGVAAVEELVRCGISVNVTFVFTASQVQACLDAIRRAFTRGVAGLNRPQRIVITFMVGRFGEDASVGGWANGQTRLLSVEERRWMESLALDIVGKMIAQSALPVMLLVSSLRCDQDKHGRSSCLHLERIASRKCIATLPPETLAGILQVPDLVDRVRVAAALEAPAAVMRIANSLPFFQEMTEPAAIEPDRFIFQPAFIRAWEEAITAFRATVNLVNRYASS